MKSLKQLDLSTLDISSLDLSGLPSMQRGAEVVANEPEMSAFQKARLGMITGSNFDRVTYGRNPNGWSDAAMTYFYEILFEWLTYQPASNFDGSRATDWGNEQEPIAKELYEKETGHKIRTNKFFKAKGFKLVGCTPDGVGKDRGIEIKSPYGSRNHIRVLIEKAIPKEHIDQITGHSLCTRKKTIDFISFDPRMKREADRIIIIPHTPPTIAVEELEERLSKFEGMLIEALETLGIDWKKGIHKLYKDSK
jgi:hypothetical protein